MKFYIGCYTNSVKEYADRQFFDNLTLIAGDNPVCVVDNTIEPGYTDRLKELTLYIPNVEVHHIDVPEEPKRTQFLRNVADSANFIRDRFLESDADHLVIIESDVIPPTDLLIQLEQSVKDLEYKAPAKPYGCIGCLYYQGFHRYNLAGLQQTHHCLSGCTLYRREVIKQIPFRWSTDNLDAFSDAWMSCDIQDAGYSCWDNHNVRCEHLSNPETGTRYSKPL